VVVTASYEGEPAIVLEEVAARAARSGGPGVAYPFSISGDDPAEVDWRPMVRYVVDEWRAGRDPARIAIDVHWTVAAMGVALAKRTPGLPVILTGGCFQNRILTERLAGDLRARGREVIPHRALSPGDGAISMGQLAHALAMAEVASPSPPGPRAGGGRAAVPVEAGWR
jgi:hydrogenase maturation protein HypF